MRFLRLHPSLSSPSSLPLTTTVSVPHAVVKTSMKPIDVGHVYRSNTHELLIDILSRVQDVQTRRLTPSRALFKAATDMDQYPAALLIPRKPETCVERWNGRTTTNPAWLIAYGSWELGLASSWSAHYGYNQCWYTEGTPHRLIRLWNFREDCPGHGNSSQLFLHLHDGPGVHDLRVTPACMKPTPQPYQHGADTTKFQDPEKAHATERLRGNCHLGKVLQFDTEGTYLHRGF
ncbi:hypothetical protein E2P81_ATG00268 [Venturia nashicola]|uniref:Uncharacterized protein n=1 Tax=Venturia nashicola TaxID=86259 RepID=A0A4Z1PWD5_9PEZI|nr:hypothetical protein E6O75_ATG00279 [Venturia nashicola]TLD39281.1 hypothetical protein E2P81_ATG00268 [Venturia nashicola]